MPNELEIMSKKPTRKKVETPFSQNLARFLRERAITQKAAAEIAGVSVSVINSWLSGVIPQDLNAVLRLSTALNADFQHMLTGEHNKFAPKDLALSEIFDMQDDPAFSGIFMIEAKKLRRK